MNKDQLLHDYIITHSAELTEKWLKLRRKLRGRFYSADQLSEEMKRSLIEQRYLYKHGHRKRFFGRSGRFSA